MKNMHTDEGAPKTDTCYSITKVVDGYRDASQRFKFAFHGSETNNRIQT